MWGVSERTQNLLQFHDCRVGSQSLMHMVILARMAGIEVFGILVVVVGHDAGNCRVPAAEGRKERIVVASSIDGARERKKREEAVGYLGECNSNSNKWTFLGGEGRVGYYCVDA